VFTKVITLDWHVNTKLKFEVWDMDDAKLDDMAKAHYVGHYIVSLADLVCIGGATGRKHLHWKNGNVLANGSISILATVIGEDIASIRAQAKEFVDQEVQRKSCVLYWGSHAPASLACLALVKTNLSKEVRVEHLDAAQAQSAQFLERNPTGTLPFLDDAGFRLDGTNTILRYLCNKIPSAHHLYPNELQVRAKVDAMLDWHLNNTARGVNDANLRHIENVLLGDKQPFIAGNALTIADLAVFAEVTQASAETLANLAHITRWLRDLAAYSSAVAGAK
jgi:glutathione S-transferase